MPLSPDSAETVKIPGALRDTAPVVPAGTVNIAVLTPFPTAPVITAKLEAELKISNVP